MYICVGKEDVLGGLEVAQYLDKDIIIQSKALFQNPVT